MIIRSHYYYIHPFQDTSPCFPQYAPTWCDSWGNFPFIYTICLYHTSLLSIFDFRLLFNICFQWVSLCSCPKASFSLWFAKGTTEVFAGFMFSPTKICPSFTTEIPLCIKSQSVSPILPLVTMKMLSAYMWRLFGMKLNSWYNQDMIL